MKAEFICNLPNTPYLYDCTDICSGIPEQDKIFVEADPSWEKLGDNLIGPAYGEGAIPGDVGIYHPLEVSS